MCLMSNPARVGLKGQKGTLLQLSACGSFLGDQMCCSNPHNVPTLTRYLVPYGDVPIYGAGRKQCKTHSTACFEPRNRFQVRFTHF